MLLGSVRHDCRLQLVPGSKLILEESSTDEWQETADQADRLRDEFEDHLEQRAGDESVWVRGPIGAVED
jgi:hypothetical protein